MTLLFDPARHEPLRATAWSEPAARASIARIAQAAQDEFDASRDSWPMHSLDEPKSPDERDFGLYVGTTGAVWALRHLRTCGAIGHATDGATDRATDDPTRMASEGDIERIRRLPALTVKALLDSASQHHGTASYFCGESAALLLAWQATGEAAYADRLANVVRGNLRNGALEALWGNPGTMLAAAHMLDAMRGDARAASWATLLLDASKALLESLHRDAQTGLWVWGQDLYGMRDRLLGAAHGFTGNVFALLRVRQALGDDIDGATDEQVFAGVADRALETLAATAIRASIAGVPCINWPSHLAAGSQWTPRMLVHDCHGAPGVVCRLAGLAPRSAAWDELLCGGGELVWAAGPLEKGASLCHGTAGSAMACLKLWRRFDDARWLDRARRLAMHAADQVERLRERHGRGRHTLWTGDLGVACALWACIDGDARYPSLEVW